MHVNGVFATASLAPGATKAKAFLSLAYAVRFVLQLIGSFCGSLSCIFKVTFSPLAVVLARGRVAIGQPLPRGHVSRGRFPPQGEGHPCRRRRFGEEGELV